MLINVQLPLDRRMFIAEGLLSGLGMGGVFAYEHEFHAFEFYNDEGYQLYLLSEAAGGKASFIAVQTRYGRLGLTGRLFCFGVSACR